jgi:hypothetical protein
MIYITEYQNTTLASNELRIFQYVPLYKMVHLLPWFSYVQLL